MPSYRLFDLVLDSNVPLQCLPPAGEPGGLPLRFTLSDRVEEPGEGQVVSRSREGDQFVVTRRVPEGLVLFTGNKTMACRVRLQADRWDVEFQGVDVAAIEAVLFTMGLRTLVSEMGRPFLHASAVVRSGRAVAFVGLPGAGKSTTAGLLAHHLGHRLVVDDVLPWFEGPAGIEVRPGPSYVLAEHGSLLEAEAPGTPWFGRREFPKASFLREPDPDPGPWPLGAVVLLGEGPARVRRLEAARAWHVLVPHFATGPRRGGAGDLTALGRLVRQVPVAEVDFPRDRSPEACAREVDRLLGEVLP